MLTFFDVYLPESNTVVISSSSQLDWLLRPIPSRGGNLHTVDSEIMSIQFPHASFGKYVKEEYFATRSSRHQQPAGWGKHTAHYTV